MTSRAKPWTPCFFVPAHRRQPHACALGPPAGPCPQHAGGFATVYRAQLKNPATGGTSTVAVKVLRPAHLLRPMHLRRFLQEVAVQRSISHPNVVKVGGVAGCCCSSSAAAAPHSAPPAAPRCQPSSRRLLAGAGLLHAAAGLAARRHAAQGV
jgi:hypothetical protein